MYYSNNPQWLNTSPYNPSTYVESYGMVLLNMKFAGRPIGPCLFCPMIDRLFDVLLCYDQVTGFFCTEGPSMMNRMPMDALQFNIRYIISSNPTMTIPFCKKMTRGEWTVCQCLMAAGYVTVCLFAPFPNARWCGTWIAWNISWIAHGISEFPLKYGEFL